MSVFEQVRSQQRYIKTVLFAGVLIVASSSASRAQTAPSNEMVKRYLAQHNQGSSDPAMAKAYSDYAARSGSANQNKSSSALVSRKTIAESDSLDKKMLEMKDSTKAPSSQTLSTYQSIIRGDIVNPDSILKTIKVFGYDVFEKLAPSTFSPSNDVSVPTAYVVSVSDEIIVTLWGRMNEEYRVKVDRDGKINIPHLGLIPVSGLPFSAMQKTILDRVQAIEGVQASVTMGDLRSMQIYVVGEVKSPGLYTVGALTNVTNALFAAGGPTINGSLRTIVVKRNGAVLANVDFYDFLMNGNNFSDIRLKSGDVISVGVIKNMAAIAGGVRRSALYELKPKTTLKELIGLAGGITAAGWVNRIQIERFAENQYQMVLDLNLESAKDLPETPVFDADIVKIFPVLIKDKNAVYLTGNVVRPGKYEFKEGMKIFDIVGGYEGLQSETYFGYATIRRQLAPDFRESIIPFNLRIALDNKASTDNFALIPQDEVIIYNRDFFEPDRRVTIDGAINSPGQWPLLENMTVRDLIISAGGLRDDASPERGELYRRNFQGEKVITEKIDFCVQCAIANSEKDNLELKKMDNVFIRSKKGWQEQKKIVLKGAFTYPGTYVILEGENLGDLIKRGGGFADDAYLPAAILTRPSVQELEIKRVDEYVSKLQLDAVRMTTEMAAKNQQVGDAQQLLEQQQMMLEKLKTTAPTGRIVIDLTNPQSFQNLNLEEGDVLYVPKLAGTVSVIGEVYNPSTFKYEPDNCDAQHFLDLTGGVTTTADKKNIYIFRANGGIITNHNVRVLGTRLNPGDVLVVPQRIQFKNNFKTFMDSVEAVFKIASVLAIVATLVITINQAKN